MSDMKLIMEGWRQYSSVDEQYDEALAYLLENYDGLLTEGIKDDILSGMKSLVKKFGKTAVTATLIAAIATNALGPGIAYAADELTAPDLPVAAQQMDASEAADEMQGNLGKAIKDIFGKDSKINKNLKDTFGKDGKIEKGIKDLFKKNSGDTDDAPDQAMTDSPEGYQKNAETGEHEFRVDTERGPRDMFAKSGAQEGLLKELIKQGLIEADSDGSIRIQGLGFSYEGDAESGTIVAKWSPERAEKGLEMQKQQQQMKQQMGR